MPPATRKRKTARAGVTKTTLTAPSPQRGIQAFGKISKSQAGRPPVGKSKARAKEQPSPPSLVTCAVDVPEASNPSRKRKAQHIDEGRDTDGEPSKHKKTKSDFDDSTGKIRHPKTPRKKALFKSIAIETPTKGTRTCLESLDLSSSPISRQASSPPWSRADTPASSPPPANCPEADHEDNAVLPDELQDLVNLHSSFLTALSLHYAHHGSLAPVDFRNLRPNIERAWRKRRVSIQDVQRILALQQLSAPTPSKLSLSDYGSSKICLEIETSAHSASLHRRLLNEEQLNKIFQANLLDRWSSHKGSAENLVSSLPLLPITPCTSTTALAPLLAKGQRRLEDLKAGAIRAQARSQRNIPSTNTNEDANSSDAENIPPSSTEATSKPPPPSLTARKTSLFDRIRAKQEAHLLSSSLKTPLTPSQLLRKSALRRIEEIVPVLELLCSGVGVKTFTMATVVQHLQMSLRNPIEKGEASRAVRLLAEEVAQGWVGVKEVGKVVGVTMRRGGMVGGRAGVMRRVRELAESL
ncbi:MAG: hypothetical protein Q9207_000413 [Kuettlingeria erythrocarpa]